MMNEEMIWKPFIQQESVYDDIQNEIYNEGSFQFYGVSGSQKPFLWGSGMIPMHGPVLIVTHDVVHKRAWMEDLSFFLPDVPVYTFPMLDRIRFITTAKTQDIQAKAMQALGKLLGKEACFVVATIEEAAQKIIHPACIQERAFVLQVRQQLDRDILLEHLVQLGYERTMQVDGRGQFAVRGDIVDVSLSNEEYPLRIEFFGDEIDTMRYFSLDTQRSIENMSSVMIFPVQVTGEGEATLFDYAKDRIVFDEAPRLEEKMHRYMLEKEERLETHVAWKDIVKTVKAKPCTLLHFLQQKNPLGRSLPSYSLMAKAMPSYERQIGVLIEDIRHYVDTGYTVCLVMQNIQRQDGIKRALQDVGIAYDSGLSFSKKTPFHIPLHRAGHVYIFSGGISEGFELLHSRLVFVSEAQIFGTQKKKLQKKVDKNARISYFSDLTLGDYVVHNVHGIGKYVGVRTMEHHGIHKDYVEIDYAGADRLYLPVDKIGQLQKYIGNEGEIPKLHRMGGSDWLKTRKKAQKSIDNLAEKLVELYAERERIQGYAFLPDQPWQREFEDAFPYEETEDQLRATLEIKKNMEEPRPMDRLLCGDVGFGKTEVAMRAVFKAVMSGKQVAVLVPTTILAQQHFQTFTQRFKNFGVVVQVLNRFRSMREKKEILKEVAAGKVDVLIGTHALLQKQVSFKDLGFLVVDEEQRFGVAQKEKWKEWAKHIDVLTLSATPIPRTLHMSLVGVREMSVIHTPPEERVPVQTYVTIFDMEVVKEAIQRELARGGQVFFVYNRIQTIEAMGAQLLEAMPDLRYVIAHGQMTGEQMERIMVDFYEGQYDVLLSTSIIETGIDIPNANTIMIYDADYMGLSQLYQMRGRVGRSSRRAYAYFFYRPEKILSEAAEKRLQAVKELTELGSGFKLAMRDLQIRGAGDLLGAKQHGNIASVGFAMYCTMLEEAIARAQHTTLPVKEEEALVIDIPVDAYLDEAYIPDSEIKIHMYQQVMKINTWEDFQDFVDELMDRFGTPTECAERFIRMGYIRERARKLGMSSLVVRAGTLIAVWKEDSVMRDWDMAAVPASMWKRMQFMKGKPTTLHVEQLGEEKDVLSDTEAVLEALEKRINKGEVH